MRKLKLELDELRVETFEAGSAAGRGTVQARDYTYPCYEEPYEDSINYCAPPPSAAATCGHTCGITCSCGCNVTQGGYTCGFGSDCTEPYVGP